MGPGTFGDPKMFESKNQTQNWDGKINGHDLSDSKALYIFRYFDEEKQVYKTEKGLIWIHR